VLFRAFRVFRLLVETSPGSLVVPASPAESHQVVADQFEIEDQPQSAGEYIWNGVSKIFVGTILEFGSHFEFWSF
jgi:hypothetical protein